MSLGRGRGREDQGRRVLVIVVFTPQPLPRSSSGVGIHNSSTSSIKIGYYTVVAVRRRYKSNLGVAVVVVANVVANVVVCCCPCTEPTAGVFPLEEAGAALEAARKKGALKVQIVCSPAAIDGE